MRPPEGGVAPGDRRRIPIERELHLDQHRLEVIDRRGVGSLADRQAFREPRPCSSASSATRAHNAPDSGAVFGDRSRAEVLDQRRGLRRCWWR